MTENHTLTIGSRVQDQAGFTGTIDNDDGSGYVEVIWDISGCSSYNTPLNELAPMAPGQDDPEVQRKVHSTEFGSDRP